MCSRRCWLVSGRTTTWNLPQSLPMECRLHPTASTSLDAEGICATAADGYLVMTALGIELDRGEQQMLTIEYADGTVIVCPLEHGAVLVMMTGGSANLGRLRLAARRFQAQYMESASAAA